MITNIDVIAAAIVDVAVKMHKDLGPGLLESVYQRILAEALRRRGFVVEVQRKVSFDYLDMHFDGGLVVDTIVNGRVVVEIKAVEHVLPVHRRQVFTYLRLMDHELGLLLNFGAALMKDGIQRIVNGYQPTAASRLRIHQ